ncbi:HpcH/HpaI aldolase family protein [Aspergillus tanneri]|uniref:HpcH/HpaI aldolase/citrate lyase domain-containing protein n=1 Tax=Aspergillus tanneri TaxID=1220188 RepID=A0A5M9MW48_9EURO|nr:uncharacterized protein ATNIH1004_002231 [Aspergillus tanneri]KAA8649560.1 hypothetical protein ATNIH1004_002231 [Aspergillus tanneri]
MEYKCFGSLLITIFHLDHKFPRNDSTQYQDGAAGWHLQTVKRHWASRLFPRSISCLVIARDAGYDVLFIDLEHSQISLECASHICKVAKLAGLLPLVRIPDESGDGFVQRVLDGGAKGVIFPPIFVMQGTRSITPSLLPGGGQGLTPDNIGKLLEKDEAFAIAMIENKEALDNIDEIASVPGLDLMLVGSMDMTADLGILGQWDNPLYQTVLQDVSAAAQRNGKLWGMSGLFGRPDKFKDPIQRLGVNLVVGAIDRGLVLNGAKANVEVLRRSEANSND